MTVTAAFAALIVLAQQDEPWKKSDLIEPQALAARLSSATKPPIIFVGFPVLYRGSHIPTAILAGPGSKPEGLEALRQAAAKLPRDAEVVIYCGCCPFDRCPNVRPAFAELRKLGFTKVTLLNIPTNMSADWISKGYPVERPKN
jgi:rhodanese-related sulfurtransferase